MHSRIMLFFLLWATAGCHTLKPPPPGTDFSGERHAAAHVKFLADITTTDANGTRVMEQQIFDGSWIVGLQATQVYLETSKNFYEKTLLEVKEGVIKLYSLVSILKEGVSLLKNNVENLK